MITTICPLGVRRTQILAFRDNTLSRQEALRISEHLRNCSDCRDYFESVTANMRLLRGRALPQHLHSSREQDRLWRELYQQISQRRHSGWLKEWNSERNSAMHRPSQIIDRGAVAILAVIVLAVTFIGITNLWLSRRPFVATSAIGVLHVVPTQALSATFPSNFAPFYFSADGMTLIGNRTATDGSGNVVDVARYALATGQFDTLYTFAAQDHAIHIDTDGRYLAWLSQPSSDTITIKVLDLQTGHQQVVASKTIPAFPGNGDYYFHVTHGVVVWQDLAGLASATSQSHIDYGTIKMFNPATGATTVLTASLAISLTTPNLFQINWPYLMFSIASEIRDDQRQLLDLTTGATHIVPVPPTSLALSTTPAVAYGTDGASVLASWITPDNQHREFAQLDHPLTASSPDDWKIIANITQPALSSDNYFVANTRLILFDVFRIQGTNVPNGAELPVTWLAWDRQLHRLIDFSPITTGLVGLAGKWLVFYPSWYQLGGTPAALPPSMTLQWIDTTSLQVQP